VFILKTLNPKELNQKNDLMLIYVYIKIVYFYTLLMMANYTICIHKNISMYTVDHYYTLHNCSCPNVLPFLLVQLLSHIFNPS